MISSLKATKAQDLPKIVFLLVLHSDLIPVGSEIYLKYSIIQDIDQDKKIWIVSHTWDVKHGISQQIILIKKEYLTKSK